LATAGSPLDQVAHVLGFVHRSHRSDAAAAGLHTGDTAIVDGQREDIVDPEERLQEDSGDHAVAEDGDFLRPIRVDDVLETAANPILEGIVAVAENCLVKIAVEIVRRLRIIRRHLLRRHIRLGAVVALLQIAHQLGFQAKDVDEWLRGLNGTQHGGRHDVVDALVLQKFGGTFRLLHAQVRQVRVSAFLVVADDLAKGAAMTNDVEIHGRESSHRSARGHTETRY